MGKIKNGIATNVPNVPGANFAKPDPKPNAINVDSFLKSKLFFSKCAKPFFSLISIPLSFIRKFFIFSYNAHP